MADDPKTQTHPEEAAAEPTAIETIGLEHPDAETDPGFDETALAAAARAAQSVGETAADVAEAPPDAVSEADASTAKAGEERAEEASQTDAPDAPDAPQDLGSAEELEETDVTRGYDGRLLGRTITLEELEQHAHQPDPEDPQGRDDGFLALVEQSMTEVTEGEIVTGRVVAIGPKEVLIDFGFKSTGSVPKNEFEEELAVGDEVEVYLERKEDRLGQPVISKEKADVVRRWQLIEDAFQNEGVLEGTIVRRIKGGMIVDLMGAEAFLPGSQVDVRPVRDFDAYLGKTMEFKVVKINPTNGNVVISHKALVEEDLAVQRDQILETMEVGQILEGTVKNIVDFGAFIDLGGVDGLLHITDLSWGRVGHPSEVIELDQKLNVVVLNYEKERQRISLGLKQLLPHPWDNIQEKYAEGQVVQGRVVSITDYGAFVELAKGIEGLVHISEMSYTEHVKHPTQKVQLGQIVDVKILNIDTAEKKISLGMKQLEPDPWEDLVRRYSPGQVTKGIVRNITSFGAFVELEPGIDGLVHVSDLSWTKRVKHPSEVVKKGQELEVMVLDVDVAQRRLSLGHKQVQTDPWQQFASTYPEDTDTTATVIEVTPDGLRVELPLDAPGFVPVSQLERGSTSAYREGDELALRVIRLDKQERDIILSETARRRAAERAEREAERAEKAAQQREERRALQDLTREARGPATLGELTGLEALKAQMEAREAEKPAARAPAEAAPEAQPPPQARGQAADEHPSEPPAKRRRRSEEPAGDPPAEKRKAAPKGAERPADDAPEAATDDAVGPERTAKGKQRAATKAKDEVKKPADEAVTEEEEEKADPAKR